MNDSQTVNNDGDSKVVGEPDLLNDQAEVKAIDTLSRRLANLEKNFRDQKQDTRGIVIGVLIALVFIIVTVAIEVIIFHSKDNNERIIYLQNQYSQETVAEEENSSYKQDEISVPNINQKKSEDDH